MTKPNGMMLWTDAYLADTGHLTTFEHGAYLLLLIAMWRAKGRLPNDDVFLARAAKTTKDKWGKIAPTIRAMLTVNEDGTVSQKRLSAELSRYSGIREARILAGDSGNRAKALKTKKAALANGLANGSQTARHLNLEEEDSLFPRGNRAQDVLPPDARTELFRRGLSAFHRMTGKPEGAARAMLGRWLRDSHDDAVQVLRTIEDAERNRVADPVAWITAGLKARMERVNGSHRQDGDISGITFATLAQRLKHSAR